jgi:hypothetical protein
MLLTPSPEEEGNICCQIPVDVRRVLSKAINNPPSGGGVEERHRGAQQRLQQLLVEHPVQSML